MLQYINIFAILTPLGPHLVPSQMPTSSQAKTAVLFKLENFKPISLDTLGFFLYSNFKENYINYNFYFELFNLLYKWLLKPNLIKISSTNLDLA